MTLHTATFAGGCFWCLEAAFSRLAGVARARSGYMGGHVEQPDYEQVCTGATGHAEVVQLDFDPALIGYPALLEVFFALHDPTTLNRQGNDVGGQYRSAIYCHDPDQMRAARGFIARLTAQRLFDRPIVTEVAPATTFWPAEDHHQGYFERHPGLPYCRLVVAPKLDKFRLRFAERLKAAG